MKHPLLRILLVIFAVFTLLVGCTTDQDTTKAKENSKIKSSQNTTKKSTKTVSKENGTVISMKRIDVPNLDSALEAYRMMYWSEGTKTEAYVSIPKGPGTYTLFVNCHGGWSTKENKTHVSAWTNGPDDVSQDMSLIQYVSNSWVTLAPMYRGYGNSDGTVNGLDGNAIDTQNAITALKNAFKSIKGDRHLQLVDIHLNGASMGGGVVLKVASERSDVSSVVAISPFVGWDVVGAWDEKHTDNTTWASYLNNAIKEYGPFDPNSAVYKKQSIAYANIKAPTLLIQGNTDIHVPWETVQIFYNKMKENNQDVTFKLVDGGMHNLSNKKDILNQILREWYSKHY